MRTELVFHIRQVADWSELTEAQKSQAEKVWSEQGDSLRASASEGDRSEIDASLDALVQLLGVEITDAQYGPDWETRGHNYIHVQYNQYGGTYHHDPRLWVEEAVLKPLAAKTKPGQEDPDLRVRGYNVSAAELTGTWSDYLVLKPFLKAIDEGHSVRVALDYVIGALGRERTDTELSWLSQEFLADYEGIEWVIIDSTVRNFLLTD